MKTFGIIGVLIGVAVAIFAVANVDYIGVMGTVGNLGLGFICSAVGVICISTKLLLRRLNEIEERMANISKLINNSGDSTAEEIVDQIRQEGLLAPIADKVTDRDIESYLS